MFLSKTAALVGLFTNIGGDVHFPCIRKGDWVPLILYAKIFVLRGFSVVKEVPEGSELLKEIEELKKTVNTLQELGEDWRKNLAIINNAVNEDEDVLQSIKRLCKENNQGNMVKIGLMLIAFPPPIVVDDILGWSFLTAGLIQRKIKNSALYLEDLRKAFPSLLKELQEIKQEIV